LRKADDGRPRLYYLRDSLLWKDYRLEEAKKPTCSEEEFEVYIWHRDKDGRATKETPVKENDHGMDLDRYICLEKENKTKRVIRAW
jgi:phage terminase large subunit